MGRPVSAGYENYIPPVKASKSENPLPPLSAGIQCTFFLSFLDDKMTRT